MADQFQELLGDLRFRLSTGLKDQYPDTYGARGFMQTSEAYFVKTMYKLDLAGRLASYYIAPGDGGGPIVVEIDTAEDGKWDDLLSPDGLPLRVLRVDRAGVARLSHPRQTQFETDLLHALARAG